MATEQDNLFTREDTMLGICQGIGEDLGFNPNWLRIALALVLFASPVGALAAYAGLGVIVLASRLLFPARRAAADAQAPAIASNDVEAIEYKLAA